MSNSKLPILVDPSDVSEGQPLSFRKMPAYNPQQYDIFEAYEGIISSKSDIGQLDKYQIRLLREKQKIQKSKKIGNIYKATVPVMVNNKSTRTVEAHDPDISEKRHRSLSALKKESKQAAAYPQLKDLMKMKQAQESN